MFSLIFCKSYKKLSDNSLRVLLKKISKNVCSPISKNILAFFFCCSDKILWQREKGFIWFAVEGYGLLQQMCDRFKLEITGHTTSTVKNGEVD